MSGEEDIMSEHCVPVAHGSRYGVRLPVGGEHLPSKYIQKIYTDHFCRGPRAYTYRIPKHIIHIGRCSKDLPRRGSFCPYSQAQPVVRYVYDTPSALDLPTDVITDPTNIPLPVPLHWRYKTSYFRRFVLFVVKECYCLDSTKQRM